MLLPSRRATARLAAHGMVVSVVSGVFVALIRNLSLSPSWFGAEPVCWGFLACPACFVVWHIVTDSSSDMQRTSSGALFATGALVLVLEVVFVPTTWAVGCAPDRPEVCRAALESSPPFHFATGLENLARRGCVAGVPEACENLVELDEQYRCDVALVLRKASKICLDYRQCVEGVGRGDACEPFLGVGGRRRGKDMCALMDRLVVERDDACQSLWTEHAPCEPRIPKEYESAAGHRAP